MKVVLNILFCIILLMLTVIENYCQWITSPANVRNALGFTELHNIQRCTELYTTKNSTGLYPLLKDYNQSDRAVHKTMSKRYRNVGDVVQCYTLGSFCSDVCLYV